MAPGLVAVWTRLAIMSGFMLLFWGALAYARTGRWTLGYESVLFGLSGLGLAVGASTLGLMVAVLQCWLKRAASAPLLGKPEEFGTITVGKRADLVLGERNPLDHVGHLQQRVGVMVRGRWRTMARSRRGCTRPVFLRDPLPANEP